MKILFITLLILIAGNSNAQHFINKAVIEYEVKSNVKKSMGNDMWSEMIKDKLPEFKTAYYTYTFSDNKSIFKFDRWADNKLPSFIKMGEDENAWFFNFAEGRYQMQKNISGTNINVQDSIPKLKWKLQNENRMIAGFNCRKAEAILFDSVYVFAFYTEEILIPGGPCSLNGLPGTILGVTIPRLYTSWIATKVMVNGVNESVIKPFNAKKQYSLNELKTLMNDRTKDWYSNDEAENKEYQENKARYLWTTFL